MSGARGILVILILFVVLEIYDLRFTRAATVVVENGALRHAAAQRVWITD